MKFFSSALFFTFFLGLSFIIEDVGAYTKGVYVISITHRGDKSFKFPDDSIFVYNESAVEKVMRLDETSLDNNKTELKESLGNYYFIDFKKGLFRDVSKNLNKKNINTQWMPIRNKESGFNFNYKWYTNEKYKIIDTIYDSKRVKKIQYQDKKGFRYEVLMRINSSKNQFPVFFQGIEDKFNADVLKIIIFYDNKKSWLYTKKFIPLKSHEVFKAMD